MILLKRPHLPILFRAVSIQSPIYSFPRFVVKRPTSYATSAKDENGTEEFPPSVSVMDPDKMVKPTAPLEGEKEASMSQSTISPSSKASEALLSDFPKFIPADINAPIAESDPYHGDYEKLILAGFSPETSSRMIRSLDSISTQKSQELLSFYLTHPEYEEILKVYHSGIERFHIDSQAVQRSHYDSVRVSYSSLSTLTASVSDAIMEEIKALESGLQLDVNLEKKKSGEAFKSVNDTSKEADVYMKNKLQGVHDDLKFVEKHARYAIIGFMSLIVTAFTAYTIFFAT